MTDFKLVKQFTISQKHLDFNWNIAYQDRNKA